MAMLLLAEAVDLATGDIQRSEQGGCAVALVIVRHGGASTLLYRQSGLRTIQRLDLALLIHRQHQRVLRRVEIKPNDGLQLVCEQRIVADFEARDPMWLQSV